MAFGEAFDAFAPHAPLIVEQLRRDDGIRAEVMLGLTTRAPGALRALEGLQQLVDANVAWAESADQPVFSHFARRIQSDLRDGITAVLTRDFAGVMDVSRDLMEISVLISDFAAEPQRLAKWLNADESSRGRDFGFAKLLGKHAANWGMTEEQQARYRGEYAIHSATLHPAPPTQTTHELTRERELDPPVVAWIVMSTAELSRHAKTTSLDMTRWLDLTGVSPAAIRDMPVGIDDVDSWLKEVKGMQSGVAKSVHAAMKAADPRSKKVSTASASDS